MKDGAKIVFALPLTTQSIGVSSAPQSGQGEWSRAGGLVAHWALPEGDERRGRGWRPADHWARGPSLPFMAPELSPPWVVGVTVGTFFFSLGPALALGRPGSCMVWDQFLKAKTALPLARSPNLPTLKGPALDKKLTSRHF